MEDQRVLAGVRVFELSVAVAAPVCGRYLAHHGAEVIKVESMVNPDVARLFGSAWARSEELADVFVDTSPYLPEMSAGKKSVGLELKDSEAMAAARRIIADCDVFLSNYTADALTRLGLTHADLEPLNERLIHVMMPGFGADPSLPYHNFRAFGPNQAPLVGFDALTGYPDQEPAGIASIAPPDYVGGMHAFMAILSALEHRDETGEGSQVVVSQMETTVSLLGPYLLDHAITGAVPEPSGNRVAWAAPSGVYPSLRHETFVAITVDDDEAWAGLVATVGDQRLSDPRFAALDGRRRHHDEIDDIVTEWAGRISAGEAAARLQAEGVAAYEVLDHRGVFADPQVRDRHYYEVAPSARFGRDLFSGHPIRLADTPGHVDWAGPNMGQHTREVLTELGGVDAGGLDALLERRAAFEDSRPDLQLERPYDRWYEIAGLLPEQPDSDAADSAEGGS